MRTEDKIFSEDSRKDVENEGGTTSGGAVVRRFRFIFSYWCKELFD
jgi:hypothetical protein